MNHEDYTKIAESTEKVLDEVDREIFKISEAALNSQELDSGYYTDLMRVRLSISEYLKEVRTDLLRAKRIESLIKEYEGYTDTNQELADKILEIKLSPL